MKLLPLTLVAAFVVLAPAIASAQSGQDSAAADALFREGRQLYAAKRYAEACPKFAESYRLDPASGAALALAACYEGQGKLASAWSAYNETAQRARREGQNERADQAQKRAAVLEPKLARMIVNVAPSASVEGLVVKRDGVVLGAPALGTRLPVDAGEHVIDATAPRYKAFRVKVSVVDGGVQTVTVPRLHEEDGAAVATVPSPQPTVSPSAAPAAPAATTPAPSAEQPAASTPADRSYLRTIGYVAGGVGIVALAGGTVFGLQAISKNDESNQNNHCVNDVCDSIGRQTRLDARNAGDISTLLVVGGVALVATGVVLFVVGGSSSKSSSSAMKAQLVVAPVVGLGTAGLGLHGGF